MGLEHVWMRPCALRIAAAASGIEATSLDAVPVTHAPWRRTGPTAPQTHLKPQPAPVPSPRERYDDIVDALTTWHPECRASTVFGMPCVKRSGRVVFGLSRTGMVFKLTDLDAHRRALAVPGAHLFDPSGRGEAFRQWVVVPPEQLDEWEPLAAEAIVQDHAIAPPPR